MSLKLPDTIEEVVELLQLIPHPEAGFFRETYRSGAIPMTSQGQSDLNVDLHHLVETVGRSASDPRRNALTSIYWMPTRKSSKLSLIMNQSAHVHYYHGGLPFEFVIYDPATHRVATHILGPNLKAGHRLQVIVEGRMWKTGRLMTEYSTESDYAIIGEAVAPGFDVVDFSTITAEELAKIPEEAQKALRS